MVMERIRLTGRELYIFYHKEMGNNKQVEVMGCTNKVVLARRSGVNYDNLVRVFTREKRHFYENGDVIIMRLYVRNIIKGSQSLSRRGKGGMEVFARYVRRSSNNNDY